VLNPEKSWKREIVLALALAAFVMTSISFVWQLKNPVVASADGWTDACDVGYNYIGFESIPCNSEGWSSAVAAYCAQSFPTSLTERCDCVIGADTYCGGTSCISQGLAALCNYTTDGCERSICP